MLDKIIGHRGASAYAPENTMASFNKAHALGCRWIEFDVMCSADGVPFVIHDDVLNRTTNGRGLVGLMSAQDLDSLDAGRWFSSRFQNEHIPRLQEVLQWACTWDMNVNIEIKPCGDTAQDTTQAVIQVINDFWPVDKSWPLLSSFNWDVLVMCRALAPEIPRGYLLHHWNKQWLSGAQELDCYSIHLNRRILTQKRVEQIKKEGYVVCSYTVNSPRLAHKLFGWGVDAVFSDYPDLLLSH